MPRKAGLPKIESHSGKYPLITRWTKAQYLELKSRANRHTEGVIMNYIERKLFDLPMESHPAPREKASA